MGIIYEGINQYPTDKNYDIVKIVPPGKVVYKIDNPNNVLFPNQRTATQNGYKVNGEGAKWALEDIGVYLQQYGNILSDENKQQLEKLIAEYSTKKEEPKKPSKKKKTRKQKIKEEIKEALDIDVDFTKEEPEIDLSDLEEPLDIDIDITEEEPEVDLSDLEEIEDIDIDLDFSEEESKNFFKKLLSKISQILKEPREAISRLIDRARKELFKQKEAQDKGEKPDLEELKKKLIEELDDLNIDFDEKQDILDDLDIEFEEKEQEFDEGFEIDFSDIEKLQQEIEEKAEDEILFDVDYEKQLLKQTLEEKKLQLEQAIKDYQEDKISSEELNALIDEFLSLKDLVDDFDIEWLELLPEYKQYKVEKEIEKLKNELNEINKELESLDSVEISLIKDLAEIEKSTHPEEVEYARQKVDNYTDDLIKGIQENLLAFTRLKKRDFRNAQDLFDYWKSQYMGARNPQERMEAAKKLLLSVGQLYILHEILNNRTCMSYVNSVLGSRDSFSFFESKIREAIQDKYFLYKIFFALNNTGLEREEQLQYLDTIMGQLNSIYDNLSENNEIMHLTSDAMINMLALSSSSTDEIERCRRFNKLKDELDPEYKDYVEKTRRLLERKEQIEERLGELEEESFEGLDLAEDEVSDITISDALLETINKDKQNLLSLGVPNNVVENLFGQENIKNLLRQLFSKLPNSKTIFRGISSFLFSINPDKSASPSSNKEDYEIAFLAIKELYRNLHSAAIKAVVAQRENSTDETIEKELETIRTQLNQIFLVTPEGDLSNEAISGMTLHMLNTILLESEGEPNYKDILTKVLEKYVLDEFGDTSLLSLERAIFTSPLLIPFYDMRNMEAASGIVRVTPNDKIRSISDVELQDIKNTAHNLLRYAAIINLIGLLRNKETAEKVIEQMSSLNEDESFLSYSAQTAAKFFAKDFVYIEANDFKKLGFVSEEKRPILLSLLEISGSNLGLSIRYSEDDYNIYFDRNSSSIYNDSDITGETTSRIFKAVSEEGKSVFYDNELFKTMLRNGINYEDFNLDIDFSSENIVNNPNEQGTSESGDTETQPSLDIKLSDTTSKEQVEAYNEAFNDFKNQQTNLIEIRDVRIQDGTYNLAISRTDDGVELSILQNGNSLYSIPVPEEKLSDISDVNGFIKYLNEDLLRNVTDTEEKPAEEPTKKAPAKRKKEPEKETKEEETKESKPEVLENFRELGLSRDEIDNFIAKLEKYNPSLVAQSDTQRENFYRELDEAVGRLDKRKRKEVLQTLRTVYSPEFLFGADTFGLSLEEESSLYKTITQEILKARPTNKTYEIKVTKDDFGVGGIGRNFTVTITPKVNLPSILSKKGLSLSKDTERVFSQDLVGISVKVPGKGEKQIVIPRQYLYELKDDKKLKPFLEAIFAHTAFDRKFIEDAQKKEKEREKKLKDLALKKAQEIEEDAKKQQQAKQLAEEREKKKQEKDKKIKEAQIKETQKREKIKEKKEIVSKSTEETRSIVRDEKKTEEFIEQTKTEEQLTLFIKDKLKPALDLLLTDAETKKEGKVKLSVPVHSDKQVFNCSVSAEKPYKKIVKDKDNKSSTKTIVPISFSYSQPSDSRVFTSFKLELVLDGNEVDDESLVRLSSMAIKKFKDFYEVHKLKDKTTARLEKKAKENPTILASSETTIEIPDKKVTVVKKDSGLEIQTSETEKKVSKTLPGELTATLSEENVKEAIKEAKETEKQRKGFIKEYEDFEYYDNVSYEKTFLDKTSHRQYAVRIDKKDGKYSYTLFDAKGNVVFEKPLPRLLDNEQRFLDKVKEDLLYERMQRKDIIETKPDEEDILQDDIEEETKQETSKKQKTSQEEPKQAPKRQGAKKEEPKQAPKRQGAKKEEAKQVPEESTQTPKRQSSTKKREEPKTPKAKDKTSTKQADTSQEPTTGTTTETVPVTSVPEQQTPDVDSIISSNEDSLRKFFTTAQTMRGITETIDLGNNNTLKLTREGDVLYATLIKPDSKINLIEDYINAYNFEGGVDVFIDEIRSGLKANS